jgi:hypothetical protein
LLKPTTILVALLAVFVATSGRQADAASLVVSGRTEVPESFQLRVQYISQSDSWLCTRYSFNVGHRLAKTRDHDYKPVVSGRTFSAELPLDAEDSESRCRWWPRYVYVCTDGFCTGAASLAPGSHKATPPASVLTCSVGERSQIWMCIDRDPKPRDAAVASQIIALDLLLK